MKKTYDFPADTAVLARIGDIVSRAAGEAGFSDDEIGDLTLAMDEACTNTITHGLKEDPSRNFQLVIEWKSGEIIFCILEQGEPFDLKEVKKPNLGSSLEERGVGGLGVFFVQQLMDEVEYHTDGKGLKTLKMVKRR